ncbi:MAG: pyridoxamine 5'-phosphate oxidase family protein [Clostridia bacterium]|nr:pyridoxamine 5'-phosphate oxidase family protein [Clostridia bacterium]
MRRKDREISAEEAVRFLTEARDGVLAMIGRDGEPYAIPVNHVFHDGCIVIHCATAGEKIENLQKDSRVCYTAYHASADPSAPLTTKYRSVVAFGRAELIDDCVVKRELLVGLTEALAPGAEFTCSEEDVRHTGVIRISIDRLTGKANL